jgi:hypothetical protein
MFIGTVEVVAREKRYRNTDGVPCRKNAFASHRE